MLKVNKKSRFLAFIIVFQILLLAGMVLNSWLVLFLGETVTLKVEPFDPHSIFQGDYVRLTYSFSALNLDEVEHDLPLEELNRNDIVYLSLIPSGDIWKPAFVTTDVRNIQSGVYLKAKVQYVVHSPVSVSKEEYFSGEEPLPTKPFLYLELPGIENYYVSPQKAKEIEQAIREKDVYAKISVYKGKSRIIELIQ